MDNYYLVIDNLKYVYDFRGPEKKAALDGINARVARGEFIAVIGPNGSGKSTLARHLNALLLPTEGRVSVNGLDTRQPDNHRAIRREVGMIFQNPDNQIVAATVEEDVAFGPENLGLPAEEIKRRVEAALRVAGLERMRTVPPHFLSGGQKQRLAVAAALAMEPGCLVCDEPTAMLDPAGREEVLQTLLRLNREEKLTVILITQFMEEAALARKIWLLDKGRLVFSGAPGELFARPQLLFACGLELPAPAEVARRLRAAGWPLSPGVLTLDDLVAGLRRIMGRNTFPDQNMI
ncbi:MAG: energy-coupling factor transporter ATPase [Bacillota bacterium]